MPRTTTTKKPTTKPKLLSADAAADQALEEIAQRVHGQGLHGKIAEKMCEISGETVSRQMVGKWLDLDRKKRIRPRMGFGLLLLWAAKLVLDDDDNPNPPLFACLHIELIR